MAIERETIIVNEEKYICVRCNRAVRNAVKSLHANVQQSRPDKGKRLINEDYEESGSVTRKEMKGGHKRKCNELHEKNRTRWIEANNSDDDTSTEMEILERDDFIKLGLSTNRSDHGVSKASSGGTNSDDDEVEILEIDEVIKRGLSSLFPDVLALATMKKGVNEGTSSEVEILDSDEIIKRGTSRVFVPSKTYINDFDFSKASSDYRDRVLNILKKPFDKEEYRRLSEDVKVYLATYPDLQMKLNEYKNKKLTCMTILRGFFFWLQNVVHDKAFKPWEDSQCLAVLPGSGQEN